MNIDKVNGTLGKALGHIREGEAHDLHSILLAEDEGEDLVTGYFEGLVDQVVETAEVDREVAEEAVMGAASELADANKATVKTEADIDAWAEKVKLAEAIATRLN